MTTGCSSATWRPRTSRPRSGRWPRRRSTSAGSATWRRSSTPAPTTRSSASRRSSTLADGPRFAAADLGAESGRVVVGTLGDGGIELEVVHRFANRPVRLPDGLRWNVLGLLDGIVDGLRAAGPVDGVGDDAGRLLGLPFHHRDARTAGMVARAFERIGRDELYAATGIQTMAINTVFQLLADEGTAALDAAARLVLIPDL